MEEKRESAYEENTTRLCITCAERPAYSSGSYCGKCASKMSMENLAKRDKRKQDLVVNLSKVENFMDTIKRMVLELEVASTKETRQ